MSTNAALRTVHVPLGDRAYDVVVGHGALRAAKNRQRQRCDFVAVRGGIWARVVVGGGGR